MVYEGWLSRNDPARPSALSPSNLCMCKWLITACADSWPDFVGALGIYLLVKVRLKKKKWAKEIPYLCTGHRLCLQSLPGLEILERVDRKRELDLGSNGFMQQLPFYILLPNKVSCNRAGTTAQHNFFCQVESVKKMTQCWGEWGFLAFPHAAESFFIMIR